MVEAMKKLQLKRQIADHNASSALAALTGDGEKVIEMKDFFSATLPANESSRTHCTGFRTAC
jgi:hypothetical protein